MHGPKPTVQEIALELCPCNEIEPVDLVCHEQLGDSDDEIDEPDHAVNHHQHQLLARRDEQQRHTIQCTCCKCNNLLQLVVEASRENLRKLELLFMDSLNFVCPWCATETQ
uniref:Protein E7 n=1 Tax=Human papillomavirus type 68b TaxID=940838 RepID=F0V4Q8_HPV68|nr:E7 protein [Human papillomavirus type 68b]